MNERQSGAHAADDPRALVEEAAHLFEAVQGWTQEWVQDLGRRTRSSESHVGGTDCQWCPLCQLMAVLRGERPELTERVVEAGTAALGALRALAEAAVQAGRGATDEADASTGGASSRVQRIDLSGPA